VDDDPTEVRGNRAATALEHSHPATDLTERIAHGIADVQPEELTGVVVRIVVKRRTGDVGADLLNRFLIHIGVEDISGLVGGNIVGGVRLPLVPSRGGRLNEGVNLSPHTTSVGEARNLKVDHVVETTERTLDTERSDKLARGGIADVLTEFAVVADERTAGFGAGDEPEDGHTILLAKCVVSSTIADEANAKLVKLILRQLEGRSGNGGEIGVLGVVTSLHLVDKTQILATTAIVQNSLGQLGKLFDSLGDLRLNLERGLQIIQADARGLISLSLEVPATNSLTEGQIARSGDATIAGSAVGKTNISPVVFEASRKDALDSDFVERSAHSLREFANANKTTPRAVNRVTLMNVNGETIRLALEQVVNCGASNSHKVKIVCFVWFLWILPHVCFEVANSSTLYCGNDPTYVIRDH